MTDTLDNVNTLTNVNTLNNEKLFQSVQNQRFQNVG